MEEENRITNLKRKSEPGGKPKRIRLKKKFSKYKLDFTKTFDTIFRKIAPAFSIDFNFYERGVCTERDASLIQNTLNQVLKHFSVSIRILTEKEKRSISYTVGNIPRDALGLELIVSSESCENVLIRTFPCMVLDKNKLYNYYFCAVPRYRVLDFDFVIGALVLIENAYNFLQSNQEFFAKNKELFNIDLSKFSSELLFNLNAYHYFKTEVDRLHLSTAEKNLIEQYILYYANQQENIVFEEEYNKGITSEYSKSFQTKKNITDKVLRVMRNNNFNKDFSYVELDSETDLKRFSNVNAEYISFRKKLGLDLILKNPELRFRKLGQHKAIGLFYPAYNCVCIDIRDTTAFIHELGHHIDFNFDKSGEQLSNSIDFYLILRDYKKAFDKQSKKCTIKIASCKSHYYKTPTEVFARCFEMYINELGIISSFTKTKAEMKVSTGYPEMDIKPIVEYFDKKLPTIRQSIEKYDKEQQKKAEERENNVATVIKGSFNPMILQAKETTYQLSFFK